MRHLSKNEVVKLFNQIKTDDIYNKTGEILAREAIIGEMVVTVVGASWKLPM